MDSTDHAEDHVENHVKNHVDSRKRAVRELHTEYTRVVSTRRLTDMIMMILIKVRVTIPYDMIDIKTSNDRLHEVT